MQMLQAFKNPTSSFLLCTYTVHVDEVAQRHLWVPGSNSFLDLWNLSVVDVVTFLLRADEERVDVVPSQELVPVPAVAFLRLVGAFQTIQSRP